MPFVFPPIMNTVAQDADAVFSLIVGYYNLAKDVAIDIGGLFNLLDHFTVELNNILSMHSGVNKAGNNFQESYPDYNTKILAPFGKFLKQK